METFVDLIGIICGVAGLIFSIISLLHTRYHAIHDYYYEVRTPELIKARRHVYKAEENRKVIHNEDNDASLICDFYNYAGLAVKKHYLPYSIFTQTGSGVVVTRLFRALYQYILDHQRRNEKYAKDFEWLYEKINGKGAVSALKAEISKR